VGDLVLVAKCLELAASELRAHPRALEENAWSGLTPEQMRLKIDENVKKRLAEQRSNGQGRMHAEAGAGPGDRAELPGA
jgi:hypothetical protein